MRPITAILPYTPGAFFQNTIDVLSRAPQVAGLIIVGADCAATGCDTRHMTISGSVAEERTLSTILEAVETSHMLVVLADRGFSIEPSGLEDLLGTVELERAGAAYADFFEVGESGKTLHPVNDYQAGSVRDDFEFGPMILFSLSAIRESRRRYEFVPGVRFAGLYDLRLKLSIDHPLCHASRPLSSVFGAAAPLAGERLFAYLDPRNAEAQREMELVFTDYLRRTGAYVPSALLKDFRDTKTAFPVEASVIIPVKDRRATIEDALRSALGQVTDFSFNVVVVDNHSTDGTTDLISGLAAGNSSIRHIIPQRPDLAIGGCWNAGLDDPFCGRYAVQLDSDDLYLDTRTLQRIVDVFHQKNCAMVIGAYTLVDSHLDEIPPALIDHREWTDDNGHNNALRVNGLGAPRAFNTALTRKFRFPNVSYGEDYAVALRISREYRVGRIYESLYLCRRWSGNTDAQLAIEEVNRNDAFKDGVRTNEIRARRDRDRVERD
jgi:hypothetical protein